MFYDLHAHYRHADDMSHLQPMGGHGLSVNVADTALFLAASVLSVCSGPIFYFKTAVAYGCNMYWHGIAFLL